jgi:hypothetical protein
LKLINRDWETGKAYLYPSPKNEILLHIGLYGFFRITLKDLSYFSKNGLIKNLQKKTIKKIIPEVTIMRYVQL